MGRVLKFESIPVNHYEDPGVASQSRTFRLSTVHSIILIRREKLTEFKKYPQNIRLLVIAATL